MAFWRTGRAAEYGVSTSRRILAALVVVILIAVLTGGVILVSQRGSDRALDELAESALLEMAQRVASDTDAYLGIGPRSLEVLRRNFQSASPDEAQKRLEREFRSLISANPELEMFNLGFPDGDFLMVKRMPDGTLSTKRTLRTGKLAVSTWRHENPGWAEDTVYADRREAAADAYDPRTRPWYRLAVETRGIGWIEPYIFYSDRMPGVNCTMPLYDERGGLFAVVSVDIAVAALSRRLRELSSSRRGKAVILTADGRIIAYPGFVESGFEIAREVETDDGSEFLLQRVRDAPDESIATAFALRRGFSGPGSARTVTFRQAGRDYVSMFVPIRSQTKWLVGVVAPESAFVGSLPRDQAIALGLTLGCFVFAIGLAAVAVRRNSRLEVALLRRHNMEMHELVAELETKSAEMERFTYTVSHDLKSPLITISGFARMIEKDLAAGNIGGVQGSVERIDEAASTMARLLGELLELAQVGRQIDHPELVRPDEVANEVLREISGPLAESGARIEIEAQLPTIWADRRRFAEVLQNLFENAIKFRREGTDPRIELGCRAGAGAPVFFVRDNGIGLSPRFRDKVFDLFQRLDPKRPGTGIGLAIVKRIVEVHGGEIWVESDGRGHGSTFCFTWPAGPGREGDPSVRNRRPSSA